MGYSCKIPGPKLSEAQCRRRRTGRCWYEARGPARVVAGSEVGRAAGPEAPAAVTAGARTPPAVPAARKLGPSAPPPAAARPRGEGGGSQGGRQGERQSVLPAPRPEESRPRRAPQPCVRAASGSSRRHRGLTAAHRRFRAGAAESLAPRRAGARPQPPPGRGPLVPRQASWAAPRPGSIESEDPRARAGEGRAGRRQRRRRQRGRGSRGPRPPAPSPKWLSSFREGCGGP